MAKLKMHGFMIRPSNRRDSPLTILPNTEDQATGTAKRSPPLVLRIGLSAWLSMYARPEPWAPESYPETPGPPGGYEDVRGLPGSRSGWLSKVPGNPGGSAEGSPGGRDAVQGCLGYSEPPTPGIP